MPRLKESEKDERMQQTRTLLLKAAADEFASSGYDGANINRISLNAGFAGRLVLPKAPSLTTFPASAISCWI